MLGVLLVGVLVITQRAQAQDKWEQVGGAISSNGDLYFDEEERLWTLGYNEKGGGLFRLEPGAEEWTVIARTADFELPGSASHIVLTEEEYVVVGAPIALSTNGGENFEVVRDDGGGKPLYRVREGPHRTLLLAGIVADTIGAAYSTDSGATWTDVFIDPETTAFGRALAFASIPDGPNAGRIVAACMNGLAYSDDGAVSWELSDTWEPFVYRAVSLTRLPLDSEVYPGRLFAGSFDATSAGALYTSDDDGETWQRAFDFGTTVGGAFVRWVGGSTLYAVMHGPPGAVWRSEDAGDTWEALTPLGAFVGEDIFVVNHLGVAPDGRLYVGVAVPGGFHETEGVYRTMESVAVSAEDAPERLPFTLEVYPNPASGKAAVALTLEVASEVRVVAYDVLGREVAVLHAGPLGAGEHALSFESAHLPAGVYLVRAEGGGLVASQRVTVVR